MGHKPMPYAFKDSRGKRTRHDEKPKKQHKFTTTKNGIENSERDRIINKDLEYNVDTITFKELEEVIKQFKGRKAPGPEEIPMGIFNELGDTPLKRLLDELSRWWIEEQIPKEQLQARIVLIFEKGDTSKLDNYRPISLLNSTYKIFAAIIQRRLAEKNRPILPKSAIRIQKKRKAQHRSYT